MAIARRTIDRPNRRTHRTHEERSAETRERLIKAAINCLHTYGYAATTTSLVAEEAGFSRGAMLHQFGTRVDLMLAVARYVIEDQNNVYRVELARYPRGKERFMAVTDVSWEVLSRPSAIALLEIMMASRSDPALAESYPALAAEFDDLAAENMWQMAQAAGIKDRETVAAMAQLHRAAMQGLSIILMFSRDPKSVEPGLQLMRWYKSVLAQKLFAEGSEAAE